MPITYLDFNDATITSYYGSQDAGSYSIPSTVGLDITGNAWKKAVFPAPFDVVSDTILEFEVSTSSTYELLAISLDTDDDFNTPALPYNFLISGTDSHPQFSDTYKTYTPGSGFVKITIPIGTHIAAGAYTQLCFVCDNDANASMDVSYRNVRVYNTSDSDPDPDPDPDPVGGTSYVGHWRDEAGTQFPTTSYTGCDFSTEVKNDVAAALSKPNDSTVRIGKVLSPGEGKLFTANIKVDTTHDNRAVIKAKLVLTSGTGDLFTTFASSYSRNTSNNTMWVRVVGYLTNSSVDAEVQVQWIRGGSGTPAGATVSSYCDLVVADMNYDDIGIYSNTVGGDSLGGTTRNVVQLNNTILESNVASIQRSGNTISIKNDGKDYLILGTLGSNTESTRTQRLANINYDGVPAVDTTSYVYSRDSSNELTGIALQDVYRKPVGPDTNIKLECFRGVGVAADEGGSDVDGSWSTAANETMIAVIELPTSSETFKSTDSVGAQTVSGTTTNINIFRDVIHDGSVTRVSDTTAVANKDHTMVCFSNIFAARRVVGSGTRSTIGSRIIINGIGQSVGEHGNYIRGNQGSQDTFGGSFAAGSIYSIADTDTISVQTFAAGDGGADDDTQPGSSGISIINLDSTIASETSVDDKTFTLETSSYSYSGNATNILHDAIINLGQSSYLYSGKAINFNIDKPFVLSSGDYGISTNSANILQDRILNLIDGSINQTGNELLFSRVNSIKLDTGVLSLSLKPTDILLDRVLQLNQDTYETAGNAVDIFIKLPSGLTWVSPSSGLLDTIADSSDGVEYEYTFEVDNSGLDLQTYFEVVSGINTIPREFVFNQISNNELKLTIGPIIEPSFTYALDVPEDFSFNSETKSGGNYQEYLDYVGNGHVFNFTLRAWDDTEDPRVDYIDRDFSINVTSTLSSARDNFIEIILKDALLFDGDGNQITSREYVTYMKSLGYYV